MLPWLSLVLCYAGFVALALAMPRHHEELRGGKPGAAGQRLWRLAGAALLAASLWPALVWWPEAAIAVSAWLGMATVAAFALAMVLTFGPTRRRGLSAALPVCLAVALGLLAR
ncbi:DUF3325 domain-containing protein [Pseudogemmobacter humi]|uniref:DUF3325 domain-containing protein n=1 Tax=Pseudogemmobacter humi TaxID=2483812 RepID=A0A3P5X471_9RHOB|nr:DUF3325 domain-containing protein [Pseudogemmobacter humi]VDC22939.1 hypothetical protein XINFAN_00881 [Pseudogemmobacter humi]